MKRKTKTEELGACSTYCRWVKKLATGNHWLLSNQVQYFRSKLVLMCWPARQGKSNRSTPESKTTTEKNPFFSTVLLFNVFPPIIRTLKLLEPHWFRKLSVTRNWEWTRESIWLTMTKQMLFRLWCCLASWLIERQQTTRFPLATLSALTSR